MKEDKNKFNLLDIFKIPRKMRRRRTRRKFFAQLNKDKKRIKALNNHYNNMMAKKDRKLKKKKRQLLNKIFKRTNLKNVPDKLMAELFELKPELTNKQKRALFSE